MAEEMRDVKKLLLAAGKDEFLERGYRGASLRRICSAAGVTTGALYFFFENKEDLFCKIVEPPLSEFKAVYERAVQAELADADSFSDNEEEVIGLLLKYRKECILLLDKAEGTRYGNFKKDYQAGLEETFMVFFRRSMKREPDPALIHLIASMRMHGYLELIYGNYPPEHARRLTEEMAYYADAGFRALMQKYSQDA